MLLMLLVMRKMSRELREEDNTFLKSRCLMEENEQRLHAAKEGGSGELLSGLRVCTEHDFQFYFCRL